MGEAWLIRWDKTRGYSITDIASGKTPLSSKKAKEIVKAMSLRSETLQQAFIKQQKKAALRFLIDFIFVGVLKRDPGAMEPGEVQATTGEMGHHIKPTFFWSWDPLNYSDSNNCPNILTICNACWITQE